jgi:hypothetical protein
MKICMEHTQLEVGSYEPFLFLKYSHAGKALLNQSWLTEIWSHLELCKGTITITNLWLPKPQRVHDFALIYIGSEAGLNTAQHPLTERELSKPLMTECVTPYNQIYVGQTNKESHNLGATRGENKFLLQTL